jgi:hypothetical protein
MRPNMAPAPTPRLTGRPVLSKGRKTYQVKRRHLSSEKAAFEQPKKSLEPEDVNRALTWVVVAVARPVTTQATTLRRKTRPPR